MALVIIFVGIYCSYAYLEFDTSEAGQEFLDKYRELPEEEQPKIEEQKISVGTLMYIQNLVRKGMINT